MPVLKVNFFEAVDWKKYLPGRITDEMIEQDGQLIRIVTGLSGATYNSALAPMKPTTLEDFLKPAWKGKIASTPYSAGFDILLAEDVWGKEKTVNYVRALSKQITGLIRCGEAERIATGEYLALVMDCTGQDALQWKEKGAPLEQMMPLDAAQQRYYYFAIPKNAQHPNAAKLYTLFMMTEEGQKLAYDTWKTDLHFLPGLEDGQDGRRLQKARRQVQGSHRRLVQPASRDRRQQERADQDFDDEGMMPLRLMHFRLSSPRKRGPIRRASRWAPGRNVDRR